jgi:predicted RNA-binding Zn-ribbon protein involved in translation (DUF1610 family)
MERKYKQKGYHERGREEKKKEHRPPEPRPRQDQLGPRTPRMVGTVTRGRCSSCGAVLAPGFDPNGKCPKCGFELHSCKQCRHFDTGAQFECTQPIPERIAKKDARNECTFFDFRMTVEKDTSPVTYAAPAPVQAQAERTTSPSNPSDARRAFEDLFRK